jgi:hypothetical protein
LKVKVDLKVKYHRISGFIFLIATNCEEISVDILHAVCDNLESSEELWVQQTEIDDFKVQRAVVDQQGFILMAG